MPEFKCEVATPGIDPPPDENTVYYWKFDLTYDSGHGVTGALHIPEDESSRGVEVKGDKTYTPNFGDFFGGGNVVLRAQADINGQQYEDTLTARFEGINPEENIVKVELRNTETVIRDELDGTLTTNESSLEDAIVLSAICRESNFNNFWEDTNRTDGGFPKTDSEGGHGLAQITSNPSYLIAWNWKRNIDAAVGHWNNGYVSAFDHLDSYGNTPNDCQLFNETIRFFNYGDNDATYYTWILNGENLELSRAPHLCRGSSISNICTEGYLYENGYTCYDENNKRAMTGIELCDRACRNSCSDSCNCDEGDEVCEADCENCVTGCTTTCSEDLVNHTNEKELGCIHTDRGTTGGTNALYLHRDLINNKFSCYASYICHVDRRSDCNL